MKKVVIVAMLVLSALSINAQSGKAKVEDLGNVLFEAFSKYDPLVIDKVVPDVAAYGKLIGEKNIDVITPKRDADIDAMHVQIVDAYGNLAKYGIDFKKPAASQVESVKYMENSQEKAIVKYSSASNGVNYTISARAAKLNGMWYIVGNILPTDQSLDDKK